MPNQLSDKDDEPVWVDDTSFYASVREPIRDALRQTVAETVEQLRIAESALEMPDADSLAYLLQRATACGLAIEPGFGEFAQSTVDTIIRQGVSSSSGRSRELAEAVQQAARALEEVGKPNPSLHLAQAVFLRTMASTARMDAIGAALRTAQGADDLFAAHLELAQLYVDTSRYLSAMRVLDDCEHLVASTQAPEVGSVEILQMRGLIHYYRGRYRRARQTFESVRRLKEERPSCSRLDRIAAEACHYLGRMEALRGNYEPAARLLVIAQRLSQGSGRQQRRSVAYFHIRLAGLLVDAGDDDETYHHLREAERALRLAHEVSTAEAQFGSVLARFHRKRGDAEKTEQVLLASIETARRDSYLRGCLVFGAQLTRFYVATRQYRQALKSIRTMLRPRPRAESRQSIGSSPAPVAQGWLRPRLDSASSGAGSVRTGLHLAVNAFRRRLRLRRPLLCCPCGASHVPLTF